MYMDYAHKGHGASRNRGQGIHQLSSPVRAVRNLAASGSFQNCYRMVRSGPSDRKLFMPLIIFLVLVVLIAMFGFWDTLSALLGSLAMIILFAAAAAGLLVLTGMFIYHRFKRRF
jgi:hypothetical protein